MKSIHKNIYLLGVALILGGIIFTSFKTTPRFSLIGNPPRTATSSNLSHSSFVKIGETTIPIELATTGAAIQKGLSGRASLAANQGMLFVFSRPDRYRFWMPDMHFPIDIIWINDDKVVDIDADVPNEFDPARPRFYIPSSPARYVLEVNAGFSKNHKIEIGDTVIIKQN